MRHVSKHKSIFVESNNDLRGNTVSAIKISLKDKRVTNITKSKEKGAKKKKKKDKRQAEDEDQEQVEIKTEKLDDYTDETSSPTTIKISLKDKTVTNISKHNEKNKFQRGYF